LKQSQTVSNGEIGLRKKTKNLKKN